MAYGPYEAQVVDVHDGDTIYLNIDLGFDHLISAKDWYGHPRLACRILGINAPELSTTAGKDALTFARTLLPVGSVVKVTSQGWDKYGGRFDGSISLADGRDFGSVMLETGHAVPFKG